MRQGHLSVRVGDGSRRSEGIVKKILNCASECIIYYLKNETSGIGPRVCGSGGEYLSTGPRGHLPPRRLGTCQLHSVISGQDVQTLPAVSSSLDARRYSLTWRRCNLSAVTLHHRNNQVVWRAASSSWNPHPHPHPSPSSPSFLPLSGAVA